MGSGQNKIVSLVLKHDKSKGIVGEDLNLLLLISTVTLDALEFMVLLNSRGQHLLKSSAMGDSRHVYVGNRLLFVSFFQMQISEEEFFLKKLSNQVGSFDLSNMKDVSDIPIELRVSTDVIIFNTYHELVDFLKKHEVYDNIARRDGGYIYYGSSGLIIKRGQ